MALLFWQSFAAWLSDAIRLLKICLIIKKEDNFKYDTFLLVDAGHSSMTLVSPKILVYFYNTIDKLINLLVYKLKSGH